MNFLADESVDRPIVERLRQEGHQVSYIAEVGPGMSDDGQVAPLSAAEARRLPPHNSST
jgi:hypothetical protein